MKRSVWKICSLLPLALLQRPFQAPQAEKSRACPPWTSGCRTPLPPVEVLTDTAPKWET